MKKNNNIKIIIMRGASGSGKTTYVTKLLNDDRSYLRVSRDFFRQMLDNYSYDPSVERLINPMEQYVSEKVVLSGRNLILDNTFAKTKHLRIALQVLDKIRYYQHVNFELEVVDFSDVPLEKCLERVKNRGGRLVPDDGVKRQIHDLRSNHEAFYRLIDQFNKGNAGEFMDIDGTLAIKDNRGFYDWNEVDKDYPNKHVIRFLNMEKRENKVILVSGRDEQARVKTIVWLEHHDIYFDHLYMRSAEDYRKDFMIKQEIFDNHIRNVYNIQRVSDDRLSTINVWSNMGIFTINVNQGNLDF